MSYTTIFKLICQGAISSFLLHHITPRYTVRSPIGNLSQIYDIINYT